MEGERTVIMEDFQVRRRSAVNRGSDDVGVGVGVDVVASVRLSTIINLFGAGGERRGGCF